MKLILGAAQFGLPYGITNYTGKMPDDGELNSILDYAFDNGIDTIDTAEAYGVANERLAFYIQNKNRKFKIINKILRYPILGEEDLQEVMKNMLKTREAFNIPSFECLMFHYASSITKSPLINERFFSSLVENSISDCIGLSINRQDDYFSVKDRFKVDLLQAPFNPLNQHILNPSFVQFLNISSCKIHIRSLFLQGLLLSSLSKIPVHLKALMPHLKKVETLASYIGESIMTLCFIFGLNHPFINGIVVGVQSQRELAEILESYNRAYEIVSSHSLNINFIHLNCPDTRLIDPMQWDTLKTFKSH